jgi:NAD-dependent SIR2 family protein deacetylase
MSDQRILDIQNGKYKKIIIMSGAGVSTNSGIPDYRGDTGIFQTLMRDFDHVSRPEDLFTRDFIRKHPDVLEHPDYLNFLKRMNDATPSKAHQLACWLNDKGWLKRVYTQNEDGLYQKAGLPEDRIVELHGSLSKDTITVYGDRIKNDVISQAFQDINPGSDMDMLIIMGTSLKVPPFKYLPNVVPIRCKRVLIDKNPEDCEVDWVTPRRDKVYKEDCDEWSDKVML